MSAHMGFPLELALRYMRSRKHAFISVGTAFAILGVMLGTAALVIVMSVTGGFRAEFREKVLGVNAHVLVLKHTSEFREYREVIDKIKVLPEVTGIGPFVINPMMLTHEDNTATGVLVKGVIPERMAEVLDLPRHMIEGNLQGLRLAGTQPPEPKRPLFEPLAPDLGQLKHDRGDVLEPPLPKGSAKPEAAALPPVTSAKLDGHELIEALRTAPIRAPVDAGAPATEDVDVAPGAPVGLVVPDGGFASELPPDPFLPPDLDADPCSESAKLPGVIIGSTLKRNLKAELGSCITISSPTIGYTYSHGAIRPSVAKQFRVTGVFEAGFDQYDSKLAYTDLYEAQAFYDAGDTVTGVEMKVRDIDRAKEVATKISALLPGPLYYTMDWEKLNHGLFTALKIQQILMSLVLALIIVVAAFTVIATLIMVVLDKKREIAVIKAMGATDWAVLRGFLYQGMIIGVAGAALGLALGYVGCRWILVYGLPLDPKVYFISRLPVQIRAIDFVLTGTFALVVCLLATVWPAMHAARLRPAAAFREQ